MAQATKAQEVERLHRLGFTPRQIAEALDITRQGVSYHLRRLGLTSKGQSS